MDVVVNIVKNNRQKIKLGVSKSIYESRHIIHLESELDDWLNKLQKSAIGCIESVEKDLSPVFNQSYKDEEVMRAKITYAFDSVSVHSNALMELLQNVKQYYSDNLDEQEVIDAISLAIEILLKDLQLFYSNLEDELQDNPQGGNVSFNPDISTQINLIYTYQKEQNMYEESSSCLFLVAAAFGFGLLLGG